MPMKTFPHPTLMLRPAQFAFGFFMKLFDPATPVLVLDHLGEWGLSFEVTPIIMILAGRFTTWAFADQPADVSRTVTVDAPAAHDREFRFERRT
jgi:hypothetical protein